MIRPPSRVSVRPGPAPPWRLTLFYALVTALVTALVAALVAGCATFPDTGPRVWRDKPEGGGPLAAPPRIPEQGPESGEPDQPQRPGNQSPLGGCVDPDPQVVATCLDPVSTIAVLPDGLTALVGERATGRILRVQKDKTPELVTTVPVDAAGGGLIGLVLSPSYGEDRLLYAYAAAPTDHRVLRIVPSDPPVPILTGIPRTAGNNSGGLAVGKDGALLVATGADSPTPAPGSLAGKLLRIDAFGRPAKGNPDPASPVFSSGLRAPGGVCTALDSGAVWVTDQTPERDVLHQIIKPGVLGAPAWTWPDRPGVAGCVAPKGAIAVMERAASALYMLRTSESGQFTGTPQTLLTGAYGRLGPAALAPDNLIWTGTVNKNAGGPVVASDDRVIRLLVPFGGDGSSGPD